MFTRRQFLTRTLQGSSLVALGAVVPQFVARTAHAAPAGKDNILVVLEMTGGNDGLNTVIPYADDLYHKARPTLRQTKDVVLRLDDHVGLHSGMQGLRPLWEKGQLAVVQGVGYPNPERSHFEAMDIWQSADPRRAVRTGWLGRTAVEFRNDAGGIPILHIGPSRLPLALTGAPGGGAVSVNDQNSFRLELGEGGRQKARRRLRLMTFSEFGRRVQENGSKGTDHGAASCLFVAGPSVKGGVVGRHPSLSDLDVGDLKFHTDFRRVYATQLGWLGCDSKAVLG